MERHSTVNVETGMKFIDQDMKDWLDRKMKKNKRELNGVLVKTTSQRYAVFMKSTTCVQCGMEGTKFAIERHCDHNGDHTSTYHLNLYGPDDTLFTKDHIVPKAKGGKDFLSNYQTMCQPCNNEKADKI